MVETFTPWELATATNQGMTIHCYLILSLFDTDKREQEVPKVGNQLQTQPGCLQAFLPGEGRKHTHEGLGLIFSRFPPTSDFCPMQVPPKYR